MRNHKVNDSNTAGFYTVTASRTETISVWLILFGAANLSISCDGRGQTLSQSTGSSRVTLVEIFMKLPLKRGRDAHVALSCSTRVRGPGRVVGPRDMPANSSLAILVIVKFLSLYF